MYILLIFYPHLHNYKLLLLNSRYQVTTLSLSVKEPKARSACLIYVLILIFCTHRIVLIFVFCTRNKKHWGGNISPLLTIIPAAIVTATPPLFLFFFKSPHKAHPTMAPAPRFLKVSRPFLRNRASFGPADGINRRGFLSRVRPYPTRWRATCRRRYLFILLYPGRGGTHRPDWAETT